MPNRIVRPGILSSDRVNALSPEAEVFYRRLMNVADDYGRFDGDWRVLRSELYPLLVDDVTQEQVEARLAECARLLEGEDEPLVRVYRVGRKRYVEITNFGQPIRTKSKFPAPRGEDNPPESASQPEPSPQPITPPAPANANGHPAQQASRQPQPQPAPSPSSGSAPQASSVSKGVEGENFAPARRASQASARSVHAVDSLRARDGNAYEHAFAHEYASGETHSHSDSHSQERGPGGKPNGAARASRQHAAPAVVGKPPPKRPSYPKALESGEVKSLDEYKRRYPSRD